MAPGGQIIGVEHIQQLCDLSINNLKKDPEHERMLRDGMIRIIRGDGRLGYPGGGKWIFPQRQWRLYAKHNGIQAHMMRFTLVPQLLRYIRA